MNVGSILNDDSPPSDGEKQSRVQEIQRETNQRHSIVSLLNDERENDGSNEQSNLKEELSSVDSGQPKTETPNEVQQEEKPEMKQEEKPEMKQEQKQDINFDNQPQHQGNENPSQDNQEDEITRLNRLKQVHKPRRYSSPPIWAQEWVPKVGAHSVDDNVNEKAPTNATALSNKSVFNTNSTSSVDLECSITGTIPPLSVTRTIAEWIYANFIEITEENRKNIELELKFGTIMDKKTNNRIDILVSTECIFTNVSEVYFDAGIHQVGFNEVVKFLEELEKKYQDDLKLKNDPSKPKRKFNNLQTDVTDSIYYVNSRNEAPKSIRVSKDNLLNPPRYTAINKQKISDLFIHNPSSMYDLRLSLSLENPIPNDQIQTVMKRSKPNLVRVKDRNTFYHKSTVTQFDLTKVVTPRELKNTTTGKKVVEKENSFEIELEADILELFNGFDQFKLGTNSIRFEELVEIFVNNARCLNNRVTKLAR